MPIANKDAPFGFRLVLVGGKATPKRIVRGVIGDGSRTTTLMPGDAYAFDGSVATIDGVPMPTVQRATASDVVAGIVEGIELRPIAASPQGPVSQDYVPVGEVGTVIGIEDEDAEFRAQITFAAAGANPVANLIATGAPVATVNLVDAPGDTILAQSRQQIDGDNTADPPGQFTLISLLDSPADNTDANLAQVVVRINKTQQSQPTP